MSKRILVVEDEEAHRVLLERILKRAGYEALFAEDGQKGKQILEQQKVDLAVVDWNMPKMNGGDLARWIRKSSVHARLPVLMVTVRNLPDQEVLGFESGVDDYLAKPYTAKELLARIERLLSMKS